MELMCSFSTVLSFLILAPQKVSDGLDEVTRERFKQRKEHLSLKATWLMEQQEQHSFAWRAQFFAVFQHSYFWVIAAVLVLLLGLFWWLRKRSHKPDSSGGEDNSSNEREEDEEGDDDPEAVWNLDTLIASWFKLPLANLTYDRRIVENMVENFFDIFRERLENSFFPVLQPFIILDSASEGWNPHKDDTAFRVLVPLKAPYGHVFYLPEEPHVKVMLICTCKRNQMGENMLCFVHDPEDEWRRNKTYSLLTTLCTDLYLDVQETALWFQKLVKSAWEELSLSDLYQMQLESSTRSCKMKLTNASQINLFVEFIFGVQEGDSEIFLTSETLPNSLYSSRTTWLPSCDVAEAKFFLLVAKNAPHDSIHLSCLHLCTCILEGTVFSTDVMKTVIMHLLTFIPLSKWCKRYFLCRLDDVLGYLHWCLKEKRLNHFFFGNEKVPKEIILPPGFREAEPLNLFQQLVEDSAAHELALSGFGKLKDNITRLLADRMKEVSRRSCVGEAHFREVNEGLSLVGGGSCGRAKPEQ
ncbi:inositol 1,4,5-trisphosphate receptor-interacting protein-like 1 [Colius striatus]|uniref:inositol 1,4,5-trisphosphate receptor-interacting protein-like 1 n=1 Tax=Colius striatus TaxID=57412 RepID=UPI002B1DE7F6|nr:inositol 1,4,5-trisphosphate receptor-interacting protein-like 1 [Colius striatus]